MTWGPGCHLSVSICTNGIRTFLCVCRGEVLNGIKLLVNSLYNQHSIDSFLVRPGL